MSRVKHALRDSWLGGMAIRRRRKGLAMPVARAWRRNLEAWLESSRETTNFTYDLEPLNESYIADFVSHITACPLAEVEGFVHELKEDQELADLIARLTCAGPRRATSDAVARYGKRVAWYAFARAIKPNLVVETGVDKGLGSVVLCAALRRNAAEGHPGRYLGTDLDPTAGFLLGGPYAEWGEVVIGDSLETLKKITTPIDLFINDSDHSAEYEAREYLTIAPLLASNGIIIGDNVHASRALHDFSRQHSRAFLVLYEKPKDHWYPGGSIGASFARDVHAAG